MGFEQAGWKVLFANDFSQKKFEMYKDFYPDSNDHYLLSDIFELDPRSIPSTTLATCSFPCIDLSLAGNLDGINGKHSSAFWGFVQTLKRKGVDAPKIIVVENVPGWLSSNGGEDFRIAVSALNALGYACDVIVLDALRFVPQSRKRVFLIGVKDYQHQDNPNRLLERSSALSTNRLKSALVKNQDLKWIYLDIPEPPEKRTSGLRELIENVSSKSDFWWDEEKVSKHFNMMTESHKNRIATLRDARKYSYRTFYRRKRNGIVQVEVRKGDTAGCLRTAVGGSSKQFIVKAGKKQIFMRNMTPREYARLQGVDDKYQISVPTNQALTGFGDAVCVPAITWIAEKVINPLVVEIQKRFLGYRRSDSIIRQFSEDRFSVLIDAPKS